MAFQRSFRPTLSVQNYFKCLKKKNGFYAFESALHVFPLTSDPETGLQGWNAASLWRNAYLNLSDALLFFAEDILQDQFCLSAKESGVLRFRAETEFMASSVEQWAEVIVGNFRAETGWPFVYDWQLMKGQIPLGKRLMPKIPFFLGGKYEVDNFWVGNSLDGMRLKGDLATQTRNLPEGAKVKLNVKPEE